MAGYLHKNKPKRSQWANRKGPFTGVIVVHTAENEADLTPPDTGAERVAKYIGTRTTAGAYHDLADSDGMLHLIDYQHSAFHAGNNNSKTLGLSFACQAHKWNQYPERWVNDAITNGVEAAIRMNAWSIQAHNIPIPAQYLTLQQFNAGQPGFIGHGDLDPTRRTDPGQHFPWQQFLQKYSQRSQQPLGPTTPMSTNKWTQPTAHTTKLQEQVNELDKILNGTTRPDLVKVDGYIGEKTIGAVTALLEQLAALKKEVSSLTSNPIPALTEIETALTKALTQAFDTAGMAKTIQNELS